MEKIDNKNIGLPKSYLGYVNNLKEDALISDLITIFASCSLEEQNRSNEINKYLPDYVAIGDDGGDYLFFLKKNSDSTVYWCDGGGLFPEYIEFVYSDFTTWVNDGCPIPNEDENVAEDENAIPTYGSIWLVARPENGLKDILQLKILLAQFWTPLQMKAFLSQPLPICIIEQGRPVAVGVTIRDHLHLMNCVGFSGVGEQRIRSYSEVNA